MNKDVIYIEPEDDITDIIGKIENSKEKIVALVPPKKAAVLRSIVNIKLIAKSSMIAGKTVVLVTVDPSIVKLAAATKIPVTKNLQSPPAVPTLEDIDESETTTDETLVEMVEESGEKKAVAVEVAENTVGDSDQEAKDDDKDNATDEETDDEDDGGKKSKKSKKASKARSDNPFIAWVQAHKILLIGLGIGLVIMIVALVWAFAIAPAATITVGIRTVTSNFSENVTFTETLADENATEGKFYLKPEKLEEKTEVNFEATGSKNIGEKAKGELIIYAFFREKGNVAVNEGSSFTINDLSYTSDADKTLSWDGKDSTKCENNGEASAVTSGCLIATRVPVTAVAPGTQYNIAASTTGWNTAANVGVYSDSAMAGGTDQVVTIVQQSDVDKALSEIKNSSEKAYKEKLIDSIGENSFVIESSFKQTIGEPEVSPKVGEEVKEGVKPKLTVTTTYTIFVVDKTKLEEFISEKAKLAENFKIYSMNDPFVENFTQTESGYVGKLKTSYVSGPKVTENDVVNVVKGKGVGTAKHDLMDIDGISSIMIDVSYPWVSSIPNNPEKITVILNVEE